MKKMQSLIAVLSLITILSVNAFAGDANFPVVDPSPTPETQAMNVSDNQDAANTSQPTTVVNSLNDAVGGFAQTVVRLMNVAF